jgi:hypothetical protein
MRSRGRKRKSRYITKEELHAEIKEVLNAHKEEQEATYGNPIVTGIEYTRKKMLLNVFYKSIPILLRILYLFLAIGVGLFFSMEEATIVDFMRFLGDLVQTT